MCRCCRARAAHSMHELRFRSLGGKISRRNSIAVCGSGVTLCHGALQSLWISYRFEDEALGAEGPIIFTPETELGAAVMKIKLGESIVSPPMRDTEIAAE